MRILDPFRGMRTITRLLSEAEAEAHRDGEELPGAEHVLLAALALPDGSARRAFERVGADADDLRTAIAAQHSDALRAIGIEPVSEDALAGAIGDDAAQGRRAFRATASGQSLFRDAAEVARSEKGSQFVGAHVIAAVAQWEHGTVARALRGMGIDRGELAAAARAELDARGS